MWALFLCRCRNFLGDPYPIYPDRCQQCTVAGTCAIRGLYECRVPFFLRWAFLVPRPRDIPWFLFKWVCSRAQKFWVDVLSGGAFTLTHGYETRTLLSCDWSIHIRVAATTSCSWTELGGKRLLLSVSNIVNKCSLMNKRSQNMASKWAIRSSLLDWRTHEAPSFSLTLQNGTSYRCGVRVARSPAYLTVHTWDFFPRWIPRWEVSTTAEIPE